MKNVIWLSVISLSVVFLFASTGCKSPSSEPESGAVKGKNLTFEAPEGDFSIVYPSKWLEASEETATGRLLTTEPQLEVGRLPDGEPSEVLAEVIGDASPVGELATSDGVTTGTFEGESSDIPITWYVKLVDAADGYVYAAVRDDSEGFSKSRASYVKVVEGLTVEREPVAGTTVEVPAATLAEAEKLARYLLDQRDGSDGSVEAELPDARREVIVQAATTFSVAQLCEWSWEEPMADWSKQNFADLRGDQRQYASALFGASNQVILKHLNDSSVACDEGLESEYRPKFESMVEK